MTQNEIDVKGLKHPILAIVRLNSESKEKRDFAGVITPYYRVTIDPANLSPSGEFIRFGDTQGDEITGFRPVADVLIEEIIGEYSGPVPRIAHVQQGLQIQLVPFMKVAA